MSPYRRQQLTAPAVKPGSHTPCPDADLLPIFFVAWCASVARVALGVAHAETFGGEATLAGIAVLGLPYLSRDAMAWVVRRWLRGRHRER